MRIGEMARAAGVSTRTVRHYHHVGVLPEPARTTAGYRDYTVRDLTRLVHARRLVEMGMSLDEVADALADDEGRDLVEILDTMDAEIREQERRLEEQRVRLAELRSRVRDGRLVLNDLTAPAIAEFFRLAEEAGAEGSAVRFDREVLSLLPEDEAHAWVTPFLPILQDPESAARMVEAYALFDRLGDPDDPAARGDIEHFVELVAALCPPDMLDKMAATTVEDVVAGSVVQSLYDELTPGQYAATQRLIATLMKTEA